MCVPRSRGGWSWGDDPNYFRLVAVFHLALHDVVTTRIVKDWGGIAGFLKAIGTEELLRPRCGRLGCVPLGVLLKRRELCHCIITGFEEHGTREVA